MTVRIQAIECGKCETPFDYSTEIPEDHIFYAFCPYCGTKNKVDLNPHRKIEESIFKGNGDNESATQSQLTDNYDLPDRLYGEATEE